MGRGYINVRATGGAVASPFEGGLGGNTPLWVRFLGVSEKMNKEELGKVNGGKTVANSSRKIKCPNCGKSVTIPSPAPAYVKCSCGTKITVVQNPF